VSEAVHPDFERMLRQALMPIDPPEDLKTRVESTLQDLTDLAVEELEAWELSAMRDPRNWPTIARPVAAVAVGATAGTALVVLRVRAQQKKRRAVARNPADLAGRTLHAAVSEARKLMRRP
jgi:hypothetical protein